MRKYLLVILLCSGWIAKAQTTGSITVGGDLDKYYPTVWTDGGWNYHSAATLEIGRSDIHENVYQRGTMIAKFNFHTWRWGNGSAFIDADINQSMPDNKYFIAGWTDATWANASYNIIIWLRGGGTTYHYKSAYPTTCTVYDGVANPLPFHQENGSDHTFITSKSDYVNLNGVTGRSAYYTSLSPNYFAGTLGIGVIDTKGYKLAVAGSAIAESVTVKLQGAWPDYVFDGDHQLPKLDDLEQYIKANKHLPEIPSASTTKKDGIDVGAMNTTLLKKVEELTLYIIELNKRIQKLEDEKSGN